MKIFGLSHIGNSRANQEDNYLIGEKYVELNSVRKITPEMPDTCVYTVSEAGNDLLAVSDGMGGHSAGEVASYITVKTLASNYRRIVKGGKAELMSVVAEANRAVSDESMRDPDSRGMGATLCGLLLGRDGIVGFNVGDSRLYKAFEGELRQLSKDHSEGQRLLDLGLLTKDELKTFPKRHAIYKYVGMKADLIPDVFEIEPCLEGAILMLCSDGLCDALTDEEIGEILFSKEPLKEKGKGLLDAALARNIGHGDNITVILTEF